MTTVAFINPSWDRYVSKRGKRYNRYWPPLDLLSCAGMLEKHGIQCDLYDQRVEVGGQIPVDDYDFIFVTSSPMDRWQCPNLDLELFVERIKGFPEDRTYLLGAHGTMDPEYVARAIGTAGVIREEPEIPVLKIVLGEDKRTVPGLTYLNSGRVISNPAQTPPPCDELPIPAYHLVDIRRYSYELMGDNFALLEASRGCPHSCDYCYLGMYPKYRLKSPERVVEEVRTLLSTTPARNIYFFDLEFAIHRRHTEAVLDALIDSGLKFQWCCQTRADSVDLELLQKMKRAGCRLVHYGVETGSPRIMNMFNKHLSFEDIHRAIQSTRKAGLNSACFFMIGFPTESEAEIHRTTAFARELNPTYASFHSVTPYLGTQMYEDFPVGQDGHFIKEAYPQALPLPKLKKLERRAYLRYYLRPSYWLAHVFTSPRGSWRKIRLFLEFLAAA
ncbi:B12-binding domain-containing radical SAM protein [Acidobacteria bacterium AH-259-D05]|nr:B12-binding domain-containing radical SAM protein [Acidobacteria bacterium AH-259-D05]